MWSTHFRKLEVHHPDAMQLLQLCSLFAPDSIDGEMLIEVVKILGDGPLYNAVIKPKTGSVKLALSQVLQVDR